MIDLTKLAHYTQSNIISYKQKIWIYPIETNLLCKTVSNSKETKILGVMGGANGMKWHKMETFPMEKMKNPE